MGLFLRDDRPTLIAMITARDTESIVEEIKKIHTEGVDAIGITHDTLNPDCRNRESYEKIFGAMKDKPVYITNYTRGNPVEHTDEELTEELFEFMGYIKGPILADIRCDLFARDAIEYTTDSVAVEKQKQVIEKIHNMGAEVLMSAHSLRFLPYEKVLEIALAQQSRGVDVVKIVTDANTEEELAENLMTDIKLRSAIDVPTLFLCNGTHCKKHRIIGPTIGSDLFLVRENTYDNENQPSIKRARKMLELAGYTDLPEAEE